ncbi:phosphoglycolate phosphatase [Monaibacterium marinum]|uniref:phosphoglycolate phosphatase n=1 Tax=Pontivivens marinum TaxID=1690039 RepID=A0A2C9CV07_9RHOB|nr:HAD family hydrolase [Monaibacterium marinum]SOH95043.1 phosphoglycolate phosphatase [Monaibacterium marinum]
MTQAIIFDKDGTLFSFNKTWAPWCTALMRDLTRDEGHARALSGCVGFDLDTGLYATNSPVIAGTPDDSADLMLPLLPDWDRTELIAHMLSRPVTPAPATELNALLTLLGARGIKLAVMTNDSEGAAREQLTALDVAHHFDAIIGYDSGHGAKPDAAPLLACATMLGTSAAQCLMVGDSLHDIHAGQAAGMRTLGVLTGIAGAEILSVADSVLPDISHLPDWL